MGRRRRRTSEASRRPAGGGKSAGGSTAAEWRRGAVAGADRGAVATWIEAQRRLGLTGRRLGLGLARASASPLKGASRAVS